MRTPRTSRRRNRRPARKLTASQRRARSPRHPSAAELLFLRACRLATKLWSNAVAGVLYPKLSRFASEPDFKSDAEDEPDDDREDDVRSVMAEAESAGRRSFSEDYIDRMSGTTAKRVQQHTAAETKRLGIPLKDSDPKIVPLVDAWRKTNVARIKGMQADQLAKIEKVLREGATMRPDTLAKRIREQVEDIPESRTKFIARSQTLLLNAKITQARHTAAGIEKYIWSASNDARVRDSHQEIDGETFSWNDPPNVDGEFVHPGEAANCRCVPCPVLEELQDEV